MQTPTGSSEEKRLLRRLDDLRRIVFRAQSKKEQGSAIQECARLIPSRYLEVNRSAITLLVNVFKDHDDLQRTIIDKAYDMAEEAQLEVRYQAIDFIVELSRKSPKWASRNADVLIQLLAADSEDADKICQSITSHLDIEPSATLRTLCRFLDPADPDINTTPELRAKLYTFLAAQDLKRLDQTILQSFREGLTKAIASASFTELSLIIHDLLLPYITPADKQELPVVKALLQRDLVLLKTDPFDSGAIMGVTKGTRNVVIKLGSPYALRLELLSFLSSPELLNSRPRFDPQDQMDLLKFLGETLDLPLNDMNAAQESVYIRNRNSVADDIKGWAKVLLTCRDQLWETAVPLLQTVLDRRRDDPQWLPDASALERLGDRLSSPNLPQAVIQQTKLAQLMIQDIEAVRAAPPAPTTVAKSPTRSPVVPAGVQPLKSYGPPPKRKAEEPLVRPANPPSAVPHATTSIKGAAVRSTQNGAERPPIRTQVSRDAPPASLLSRLALDRTSSSSPVPKADANGTDGKDSERPNKRRRQDEAVSGPPQPAPPSRNGSLLSRINTSGSSPVSSANSTSQSFVAPAPLTAGGLKIGGAAGALNGPRSTVSAPPTPATSATAKAEPPQAVRTELSLKGAAAKVPSASVPLTNGSRNRTVSASTTSEAGLPPRPTGLSIKGASSSVPAGPPGQLGFQKALAGLGKPESLPPRPRDVLPPAPPPPPARPQVKKQPSGISLLSRFSDSAVSQPPPPKSRGSLADRMDLG